MEAGSRYAMIAISIQCVMRDGLTMTLQLCVTVLASLLLTTVRADYD